MHFTEKANLLFVEDMRRKAGICLQWELQRQEKQFQKHYASSTERQQASFPQAFAITDKTNIHSPLNAHFCPSKGPAHSIFLEP